MPTNLALKENSDPSTAPRTLWESADEDLRACIESASTFFDCHPFGVGGEAAKNQLKAELEECGLLTKDAGLHEECFGRLLHCCMKGAAYTRETLESTLNDKSILFDNYRISIVQQCLRLLGYDVPAIDGCRSPHFEALMEEYSRHNPYSIFKLSGAAARLIAHFTPRADGERVGYLDAAKIVGEQPEHIIPEVMRPHLLEYMKGLWLPPAGKMPRYQGAPLLQQFGNAARPHILVGTPGENIKPDSNLDLQRCQNLYTTWLAVCGALETAGASLEIVEFNHKDLLLGVFPRDRVFILGRDVFIPDTKDLSAKPKQMTRRAANKIESGLYAERLKALGYNIHFCEGSFFEGGQLHAYHSKNVIFAGYAPQHGFAHLVRLAAQINEAQNNRWKFVFVPLKSSNLYHLDVGMTEELPDGDAGICKQMTTQEIYSQIIEIIGKDKIIDITYEEASRMAANLKMVGRIAVLTGNAPLFAATLNARNYGTILPADMGQSNLVIAEGGVHCMTNDLLSPLLPRPL